MQDFELFVIGNEGVLCMNEMPVLVFPDGCHIWSHERFDEEDLLYRVEILEKERGAKMPNKALPTPDNMNVRC
jgi:hypothetical protein